MTLQLPRATRLVKTLTAIVFAAFVVQLILQNWLRLPTFEWFALNTSSLGVQSAWQMCTYPFAAPTSANYLFNFLINLLFMWWMLSAFEARFGNKRTLELCAVSALFAGVAGLLIGQLMPAGQPLFGTACWLLSATSGFAWSFRGQGKLSFFGVIDLTAEQLVGVVVGLSVLMFLASGQIVQLVADLAAIAAGIFLVQRPRRRASAQKASGIRRDSQRLRLLN